MAVNFMPYLMAIGRESLKVRRPQIERAVAVPPPGQLFPDDLDHSSVFTAKAAVVGKGIAKLTTLDGEMWVDTDLLPPGDLAAGVRYKITIHKVPRNGQ